MRRLSFIEAVLVIAVAALIGAVIAIHDRDEQRWIHGGSNSGGGMVWCVGPDEKITPAFRREYPDLYMSKKLCDLWEKAADEVAG